MVEVRQPYSSYTVDQLLELDGVWQNKAETLHDEYANTPTLNWATWHDRYFLQNTVQIDGFFLYKQLTDHDQLHENFHDKSQLVVYPDRPDDYERWQSDDLEFDMDHYGPDHWKD